MSLYERIGSRANPLAIRHKEMFDEANAMQKEVMEFAANQDAIYNKIIAYDELTEKLIKKKALPQVALKQRLELRTKSNNLMNKGEPLIAVLLGHTKPLVQEIFDFNTPLRNAFGELQSELITEHEAHTILLGLEAKMAHLETNLVTFRSRLTACQDYYKEMVALYNSVLN